MVKRQSDGSVYFYKKGKPIFIFAKQNYDKHCNKRDKLKLEVFLDEIDKTLFDCDVITQGPQKDKRTYYKVFKNVHERYNVQVRVMKVPVFRRQNKRRIYSIATAFDFWGLDYEIIHPAEKKLWQKAKSLI